jgi:hypothetical protein
MIGRLSNMKMSGDRVCMIDQFDKMKKVDRTSIHEATPQHNHPPKDPDGQTGLKLKRKQVLGSKKEEVVNRIKLYQMEYQVRT